MTCHDQDRGCCCRQEQNYHDDEDQISQCDNCGHVTDVVPATREHHGTFNCDALLGAGQYEPLVAKTLGALLIKAATRNECPLYLPLPEPQDASDSLPF